MVNDYQVPQTPASLAQMSLAQRAEQAVLQERALEGQNEGGHVGDNHTVTIVGSSCHVSTQQVWQSHEAD